MQFPNNKGLHQNPGPSTIGAQIGAISMRSSRQSRRKSTRSRRNRPENDPDQHNQHGLQLDCKITKDCKEINRIASTVHNPTTVRGDCKAIQKPQQSVSIQTQFGRIASKSTTNANSHCNRHQISKRLRNRDGLPGNRMIASKSLYVHKLVAIPADCPQNRPPVAIGLEPERHHPRHCNHGTIFSNSVQSRGLWWDCIFNTIQMKSCFKPPYRQSIPSYPILTQPDSIAIGLQNCK